MSNMTTTDSVKRSARTGVQGGVGIGLLVQGYNLFSPHPLSAEQTIWVTAAGAAAPAIASYVMNVIEEMTGHSFLKGGSGSLDLLHAKLDTIAAEVGRMGNELERRGLVTPTPQLILEGPEIRR